MRQKTITTALTLAAMIIIATATAARAADLLEPATLSFSTGKITQTENRSDLYFVSLHPGFEIGNFSAYLDLNFIFDEDFAVRDGGNDMLLVSSVEYESKDKLRFYYGDIESLTFGSGFIVSNYRSTVKGNVPLRRMKGYELELYSPRSVIHTFVTRTGLVGTRAVRNMGRVTVGATAVSDSEPDFEEIAVDVQGTVVPDKLSLYAEVAKITHYGEGFALGALGTPLKFVDFKAEVRDYDADFAPGIVDEHYEVRPVVDRLKTAQSGRMIGIYTAVDFFRGRRVSVSATYEDYEDYKPRYTLTGRARITNRVSGDVFFAKENFILHSGGVQEDSIASARLYVKATKRLDLVFDFYNAFDDNRSMLESLTVKTIYRWR